MVVMDDGSRRRAAKLKKVGIHVNLSLWGGTIYGQKRRAFFLHEYALDERRS
jgi:hypothetical protein